MIDPLHLYPIQTLLRITALKHFKDNQEVLLHCHCTYKTHQKIVTGSEMSTLYFCLWQWSQTQFLEGHSSAEFSSNQLQITPAWRFLVILKSFISWIRCVWLGLELNSAEVWSSRNWVWDQWSMVTWHAQLCDCCHSYLQHPSPPSQLRLFLVAALQMCYWVYVCVCMCLLWAMSSRTMRNCCCLTTVLFSWVFLSLYFKRLKASCPQSY